jgi:uncharacterized protein (DUF952 family)
MSHLLHITTPGAWAQAREAGSYTADSLQTEGFIHCSEPRQVIWVANTHFRGKRGLVLLHIDPSRLNAEVRYENLEGGSDLFPHVYGAIPTAAVVNVTPFEPDEDGTFRTT